MADCLIGLGSNQGDRTALLTEAVSRFCEHEQVRLVARSRWFETKPVGGPDGQGEFLNGAIRVATSLTPQQVLHRALEVEQQLGRQRGVRWSARRIDIDLLLYDQLRMADGELQVPHPRMAIRRFVLVPSNEIAKEMVHPGTGWTLQKLLEHLNRRPRYIAIASIPGAGADQFLRRVEQHTHATLQVLSDDFPARAAPKRGESLFDELQHDMIRLQAQLSQLKRASDRSTLGSTGLSKVIVSDFWLPETMVRARVFFDQAARRQLAAAGDRAVQEAMLPNLILHLDTPLDLAWNRLAADRRHWPHQLTRDDLANFREHLMAQLSQPHQGPVISVADGDISIACTECLAAIDSMQELSENRRHP
jgi:2-amino-4-hydroxy-6-hydroxymethyldihydropteridine diphosphokinase